MTAFQAASSLVGCYIGSYAVYGFDEKGTRGQIGVLRDKLTRSNPQQIGDRALVEVRQELNFEGRLSELEYLEGYFEGDENATGNKFFVGAGDMVFERRIGSYLWISEDSTSPVQLLNMGFKPEQVIEARTATLRTTSGDFEGEKEWIDQHTTVRWFDDHAREQAAHFVNLSGHRIRVK